MKKILRLGTRGSPLALIQAQIARQEIFNAHPSLVRDCEIEIVPIRTTGDWKPGEREQTFLEMNGTKGLFTKEIEEALLSNTIDLAVHSMKDVSVWAPEGLCYAAMLQREDPRDAFFSSLAPRLEDLPSGACVGTSSLRRKAQVLALRPDLRVVPLRGNVDTRLRKLAAEEADATLLAVAGINRLSMGNKAASILSTDQMLPAPAQGILGIEVRQDDNEMQNLLKPVNHLPTEYCAIAERAFLRILDGSCRAPVAALATITTDGHLELEGLAASPDGKRILRQKKRAQLAEAESIGKALGEEIKSQMPPNFFDIL